MRNRQEKDMTGATTLLHLQQAASAGVKGHLSAEKCKTWCRTGVGAEAASAPKWRPGRPFAVITSPSPCKQIDKHPHTQRLEGKRIIKTSK